MRGPIRVPSSRFPLQRLRHRKLDRHPRGSGIFKAFERKADRGVKNHKMGNRISGNHKRRLAPARGKNHRFARAKVHGAKMDLKAEPFQGGGSEIVIADTGSAGNQKHLPARRRGFDLFDQQFEPIAAAALMNQFGPRLRQQPGDQCGIRIADLARTRRLCGRHQFIAGDQVDDPRSRPYERFALARLRQECQLRCAEACSFTQQDIAAPGILAAMANMERHRLAAQRPHPFPFPADFLLHEDLRGARREAAAGKDPRTFTGAQFKAGQIAGAHFGDHFKGRRKIVRCHGITVHGGAIKSGKILGGDRIGGEDASMGGGKRRGACHQRRHLFADYRARFLERNHDGAARYRAGLKLRTCSLREIRSASALLPERGRFRCRAMQLKLLAFAQAHDLLGFQERLVEVEPEETPRRLLGRLAPLFDAAGVRVAIDCEYCSWDTPIGAQARELAIIPPVSGG